MVHEVSCESERNVLDIHQPISQNPALFVTPISGELKCMRPAQRVVSKTTRESLGLDFTQAAARVEVVTHKNMAKIPAGMTAKGIMDVCAGHSFYIMVANFVWIYIHLPKDQKVGKVADAPVKIVRVKSESFSYLSGSHANTIDGSVYAVQYRPIPDRHLIMEK